MAKVRQMTLVKQSLGKYSKVLACDESMLDETIEIQPETKEVKDNVATAALEVMDVVDLHQPSGESEEVVVVETPKMDDETIKVQSRETGVIADIPVEMFSKATKISKAKLKAYSEAEEAAKKASEDKPADPKPEDKTEETPANPKPEDKPEDKPEGKPEDEMATASEEKPEDKPEDKPEETPKGEEEVSDDEEVELETNSLSVSISDGSVYAYSCEGECDEIITEGGELDTVVPLDEYCGTEATYAKAGLLKGISKGWKRINKSTGKKRNIFQKVSDAAHGRDAEAMEKMAKMGISRKEAKMLGKKGSASAALVKKMPKVGVQALANAGLGTKYVKDLYYRLGGLEGIREKKEQYDQLISQMNGRDPEEIQKISTKLQDEAKKAGALDKVIEVKTDYKNQLAAASQTVMVYSKFKYAGAPMKLGVYSEDTNEITEAVEAKAEAAAEVAEHAAEVEQPKGTEKLPIVIEQADNGFTITASGETKVAVDVKSVCNIITELLETKMDAYSQMKGSFKKYL